MSYGEGPARRVDQGRKRDEGKGTVGHDHEEPVGRGREPRRKGCDQERVERAHLPPERPPPARPCDGLKAIPDVLYVAGELGAVDHDARRMQLPLGRDDPRVASVPCGEVLHECRIEPRRRCDGSPRGGGSRRSRGWRVGVQMRRRPSASATSPLRAAEPERGPARRGLRRAPRGRLPFPETERCNNRSASARARAASAVSSASWSRCARQGDDQILEHFLAAVEEPDLAGVGPDPAPDRVDRSRCRLEVSDALLGPTEQAMARARSRRPFHSRSGNRRIRRADGSVEQRERVRRAPLCEVRFGQALQGCDFRLRLADRARKGERFVENRAPPRSSPAVR